MSPSSSVVFPCLVLILLSMVVICSAQTPSSCGITSIGGNFYNFSGIGAVLLGINPASSQIWAYTVCGRSTRCTVGTTGLQFSACTGALNEVPLALVGDPIQWSFVDAQRPQLGVLAQYPLTRDIQNVNVFRQLTVLFACGPDTVAPGQQGPGFAALQGASTTSLTSQVIQYNFVVPTSVVCAFINSNIDEGAFQAHHYTQPANLSQIASN